GLYAAGVYYRYSTETIKDREGNKLSLLPGDPTSLGINAYAAILWYVSKAKIFGANYGAFVVPAWVDGSLEAPALSLDASSPTKFTDLTVRVIDLGWHLPRADVSAGFQFYAPTGTYEAGGNGNTGKGMWTYEPFLGTTVYFDQKRTVSLAATAFLEFHGKKKDTDVKVGEILSLEGGLGKSFLGGGLIVGAAYYAQWKLGADELGSFTLPGGGTVDPTLSENKHKVFGFGPDLTLPVATKSKLYALVNFRYLWETGARTKTEGNSLLVTATFPIPSVKLK
ncbi:MAG: SphA family protein, partial [Gemmatimonadales bacterium]